MHIYVSIIIIITENICDICCIYAHYISNDIVFLVENVELKRLWNKTRVSQENRE